MSQLEYVKIGNLKGERAKGLYTHLVASADDTTDVSGDAVERPALLLVNGDAPQLVYAKADGTNVVLASAATA